MTDSHRRLLGATATSVARSPARDRFPLMPALGATVAIGALIVVFAYVVLGPALGRFAAEPASVTQSVTLTGTQGPIAMTYAVPANLAFDITDEYVSTSANETTRAIIGFTQGGTGLYGLGEAGAEQAWFDANSRGVVVADVTATKGHGLRGRDLGLDAATFVDALADSGLWEVGDIGETTLARLPAVRGRSTFVADYWSHLDTTDGNGTLIELGPPSEIIVTDVGEMTVMVQVWAGTDGALDAWLPTAMELVESFRFGTTE